MHKFLLGIMGLTVGCAASAAETTGENAGHRFGEWPAINAVIHDADQRGPSIGVSGLRGLNFGRQDFLMEIWFQPLPRLPAKGDAPNSLICKKCSALLPGYELSYTDTGQVTLTLCDRERELETDLVYRVDQAVNSNAWTYFAVFADRTAKRLAFYKDGALLREFGGVELGDLSNHDMFSIGYCEYVGNSQAHCLIREVRVWTFARPAPTGVVSAAVAAHHARPDVVADALVQNAGYSRWVFTPDNNDVRDLGDFGNTLRYVPWGYQPPEPLKPFPATPTGRTYVVHNRHPQADDGNPGTGDKPFKTIRRAAKAAGPGDLILVKAGRYREAVLLRAGENGQPITLRGEEGAIITGGEPLTGWQRAEDLWVLTNWTGNYNGPIDPKEDDARAHPGHVLFVDETPMEFVLTRAELIPGTWTVEPVTGHAGPKTFLLRPLPGVDPTRVSVELSDARGAPLLTTTRFNHVQRLRFTRGSVAIRGIGNRLEDCVVEWTAGNGIGISGQDNTICGNQILWCGHTGIGGVSLRTLFERNRISYCSWRPFRGSWHGGAVKLIPANLDFIMRRNEIAYNYVSGIWYDAFNQGTINEDNICHDNVGPGLFDEFCFGNTWRYNVSYNNVGQGFCVGNSKEDLIQRNIFFNNYYGGISFRTDAPLARKNPPDRARALAEEFMAKLDVRRYQGMLPYEREKRFRDMYLKYGAEYDYTCNFGNQILENVIVDHGPLVSQAITYGQDQIAPEFENTFRSNIYWSLSSPERMIQNGRRGLVSLAEWQQASGQDSGSRALDPWQQRDELPGWFRDRFPFRADEFRPAREVWDRYIANRLRRSIAQVVLFSRLLRSRTVEELSGTDPDLTGLAYELEGQRAVSVWCRGPAEKMFLLPGMAEVIVENKFLQRRTVAVRDGRLTLYLDMDPVTLIGVPATFREDRSVAVELPRWTPPGTAVTARVLLENADPSARAFDLTATVAPGWQIENAHITRTLEPGTQAVVELHLNPPVELTRGLFQLALAGRAGANDVRLSRGFGIGSTYAVKHTPYLRIDGDLSDWDKDAPTGIAAEREQVVAGAEHWQGPADLSARIWLKWNADRELFFAAEVTDDQLVTTHRADKPTASDSVQLFVDARAPWKQFMKDYTLGAFRITMVPGDGDTPATATYDGQPFGNIAAVASRKTAAGYTIELQVHFRSNLVEEPGWVAGREIRAGVLVNDADQPQGTGPLTTMGVWRTAVDAGADCGSLTTLRLEP